MRVRGMNDLISNNSSVLNGLTMNEEGLGGQNYRVNDIGKLNSKNLNNEFMDPTMKINQPILIEGGQNVILGLE